MSKTAKTVALVLVVITMLGVGVVSWGVGSYNSLVGLDEGVNNSWAQVENVLQRRSDLIPNLVNTVEASMKQEQDIFIAIAESRQSLKNANNAQEASDANNELNSNLNTLVSVIHESYPELASNQNIQELMAQLEGTEDRISVERKRYNDDVTVFNTKIRQMPLNIIAGVLNFEQKDLFEMSEGAEVVPDVQINVGGN